MAVMAVAVSSLMAQETYRYEVGGGRNFPLRHRPPLVAKVQFDCGWHQRKFCGHGISCRGGI